MNALMVVAQIIPVLLLGILAEGRTVILSAAPARTRLSGVLILGASVIGLVLIELIVLSPLAVIPDAFASDPGFVFATGGAALGLFLLSTGTSTLILWRATRRST